jgi:hypothetical protein
MSKSLPTQLTNPARFFLEPSSTLQRQYEALRAYFVEGLSSAEAASRFGYTPGSFRVLCHQFRHDTAPQFFATIAKGPQTSPKSDPLREQIIQLRKQNFSTCACGFRGFQPFARFIEPPAIESPNGRRL